MTEMSGELCSRLADHWEKSVLVLPTGAFTPLSTDQFFQLIKRACLARRLCDVWIDGTLRRRDKQFQECMIAEQDQSFETYERRLEAAGISDYMVRLGHFHTGDFEFWNRVRRFLLPLFRRVGIPNVDVTTGVFMGRYKATAFGIHFDDQSALTFPIYGRKVVRTWPFEYGSRHPEMKNSFESKRFAQSSVLLEADPGGAMYWPSQEWHIGEGHGHLVVTWNVSFWYQHRELENHLAQQLASFALAADDPDAEPVPSPPALLSLPWGDPPSVAASPPAAWINAANKIKRQFQPATVDRMAQSLWRRRVSASGFSKCPEPDETLSLDGCSEIRCDPDFPVIYHHDGEQALIAANGHEFAIGDHPALGSLIDRINSGAWLQVASLREGFARSTSSEYDRSEAEEFVHDLLEALLQIHSIAQRPLPAS